MGITWARYVTSVARVSTDLCELAKRPECHSMCSRINGGGCSRAASGFSVSLSQYLHSIFIDRPVSNVFYDSEESPEL